MKRIDELKAGVAVIILNGENKFYYRKEKLNVILMNHLK